MLRIPYVRFQRFFVLGNKTCANFKEKLLERKFESLILSKLDITEYLQCTTERTAIPNCISAHSDFEHSKRHQTVYAHLTVLRTAAAGLALVERTDRLLKATSALRARPTASEHLANS